ncbi:DUF6671 family protein [Flavobacterium litorale]|uniref:DUF6671 domain-containing protein n=1 Tax=Flavobacterium litorale TaxID=2856519 RepID=A0ABX8V7S3_9FLAO|nr:DUF6671 family protein [Flavobacterium litorale]QYJ68899.1 hypothetical protein K1I41_03170 [Flavobacterium litorale]
MFEGRPLAIATMHKKESVIAPILETVLGVHCFTPYGLDTNTLGTFTGEIPRTLTPLEAARQKCHAAMELSNCDLAVASEGSFGAHPNIPFLPANEELLVLVDKKNDVEIVVRELSITTNFNGEEVRTMADLYAFAKRVNFPEHAIVLRDSRESNRAIHKGITRYTELENFFTALLKKYGTAYAETDMRAMYNPTRMQVIQAAANKLASKALVCCPACDTPGFGVTATEGGLPCSYCSLPTKSVLHHVSTCTKCNYTSTKKYPTGKTTEDPQYCDYCNP